MVRKLGGGTVHGAEQDGVPWLEGCRGETGSLPLGVQPVPGQKTPFSFISSLESLRASPCV